MLFTEAFISPSSDTPASAKKKTEKTARRWEDSSITEQDMAALDFSTDRSNDDQTSRLDLGSLIDETSLGTKKDGIYEIKDWDFVSRSGDEQDDLISKAINGSLSNGNTKETAPPSSALGNIFARLTGSKVLTEHDLKPVLSAMKEHLMTKNVAKDIAEQICEGVGETLKGKKIGGFRG